MSAAGRRDGIRRPLAPWKSETQAYWQMVSSRSLRELPLSVRPTACRQHTTQQSPGRGITFRHTCMRGGQAHLSFRSTRGREGLRRLDCDPPPSPRALAVLVLEFRAQPQPTELLTFRADEGSLNCLTIPERSLLGTWPLIVL